MTPSTTVRLRRRRQQLLTLCVTIAAVTLTLRRRVYLTRASLSGSANSAAATLLVARQDRSYISVFGFDVASFELLLQQFQPHLPAPSLITRRPRALTPELHLGLTLFFLTTPTRQKTISLVFGVTPAVVSRSIWSGLRALQSMMEANKDMWAIRWPSPITMHNMATAINVREPLLHGVFGFVDGLNLRIQQPGDIDEQNAYYNGWLCDTYCSQVLVFLANGEIAWVSFNNPGSWHDSRVAQGLYNLLADPGRTPPPFALLADSAFPCGRDLAGRILSRPKENVAGKGVEVRLIRLWDAIVRQRQAAEWGMRAIQGAFGRLALPLPTHKSKRSLILSIVFSLHNFRTRHVGLSQIKEVYFPEWQSRSLSF